MNVIVLMFVVGLVLMAFEVFLPGGILGVIGAVCMAFGVGLAFYEEGRNAGFMALGVGVGLSALMLVVELWLLPRTRFGRRMFLDTVVAGTSQPEVAQPGDVIGQEAETVTPLAPTGVVVVGGRRFEAYSRVGYIEIGARVRILGIETFRLIVTKTNS